MPKISGAYTALITPFNSEYTIDWLRLEQNIRFQIQSGIDGLVPVGTTGESPTLLWDEHMSIIQRALKVTEDNFARDRVQIIAGTGSNSTLEALKYSAKAVRLGANGVLLVTPYYNRPTSRQMAQYYFLPVAKEIAEIRPNAIVMPYDIPGRTASKLEPVDLAWLVEQCPNITGIKDATGGIESMVAIRRLLGKDFSMMSGDDNMTGVVMGTMNIRGNGVISVISNIAPAAVKQMVTAFATGDDENGVALQKKLIPLFNLVSFRVKSARSWGKESFELEEKIANPCPIKTMMAGLG
ncbi:MAG TPA: 4-hydroxy-tetrahydrodipicolinate synthase, partial [Patescibacteria group bacterium]|nr:4-hydroxy-tetrahydrodipicolinate synthase [Patescibacteria group bacterium]